MFFLKKYKNIWNDLFQMFTRKHEYMANPYLISSIVNNVMLLLRKIAEVMSTFS